MVVKATQTEIEVAVLKEQVGNIESSLKLIQENHLPHITADIGNIKVQMARWGGALALISAGVPIALSFLK